MKRRTMVKTLSLMLLWPLQKGFATVSEKVAPSGSKKDLAKKVMEKSLLKEVTRYESNIEMNPLFPDDFASRFSAEDVESLKKIESESLEKIQAALQEELNEEDLSHLSYLLERSEFQNFVRFYNKRYKKIFSETFANYSKVMSNYYKS